MGKASVGNSDPLKGGREIRSIWANSNDVNGKYYISKGEPINILVNMACTLITRIKEIQMVEFLLDWADPL